MAKARPHFSGMGKGFTVIRAPGRQREEAARHQLELQMQHTQRLESLGVLAGGIATVEWGRSGGDGKSGRCAILDSVRCV
jgi:hypothetical protein